jgi:DNA-binding NarL/FixJ family response regulator
MKVFVADGSSRLCQQIIDLLSGLNGVELIGQAQDAREACKAIGELSPDVVTLDIQMSGGSGMEVLKQLKREGHTSVVIMLTNRTSLPYRKGCIAAGRTSF